MINMKIIWKVVRKIIFAFTVLYSFNLIMNSLNIFIPINMYSVALLTVLGFPGLFVLVGLVTIL